MCYCNHAAFFYSDVAHWINLIVAFISLVLQSLCNYLHSGSFKISCTMLQFQAGRRKMVKHSTTFEEWRFEYYFYFYCTKTTRTWLQSENCTQDRHSCENTNIYSCLCKHPLRKHANTKLVAFRTRVMLAQSECWLQLSSRSLVFSR